MFKAIIHSKFRGLDGDKIGSESLNWSKIYRGAEDFETAAVFTRLSYIPSEHFWAILRRSFKPVACELPEYCGDLLSINFWPRYEDQTDDGKKVEPDVLLRFEEMDVIVEVKRGDGGNQQSSNQLIREWKAVCKSEDGFSPERTWLLALGGMIGGDPERLASEVSAVIPDFRFAASTWRSLAKAIRRYRIPADSTANRILSDLAEILSFHGHKEFLWCGELVANAHRKNWHISGSSLNVMRGITRSLRDKDR